MKRFWLLLGILTFGVFPSYAKSNAPFLIQSLELSVLSSIEMLQVTGSGTPWVRSLGKQRTVRSGSTYQGPNASSTMMRPSLVDQKQHKHQERWTVTENSFRPKVAPGKAPIEIPKKPLGELELRKVNPGWSRISYFTPDGRTDNCACAAYATDLRLSGVHPKAQAAEADAVIVRLFYEPSMIPFIDGKTTSIHNLFTEYLYGRKMKKVDSFDDIERELLAAGPGARAFVDSHVRYQSNRHAFNAVTVLDEFNRPEVIFLDGQRNRRMPKWFVKMSFSDPAMLRTDTVFPSRVVWSDVGSTGISWDFVPSLPPIPLPIPRGVVFPPVGPF